MTTGEKIAKCRREQGLTQTELAELMGVTRQAVSRWESDAAFPETDKLIKLSKVFGCSTDWLLNYNEENFNSAGDDVEEDENVLNIRLTLPQFEYVSKTRIGNLPLVHINIGVKRTAKGFIAIGFKSVGVITFGLLSLGVISVGLLALGVLGFGVIAAGLVAAGSVSVGALSFGAVAVGLWAMGGCAVGLFSVGGYAAGYYVAVGGRAVGGIAIGGTSAQGRVISATVSEITAIKEQIYSAFEEIPAFWTVFVSWARGIFEGVLSGNITLGNAVIS